MQQLLHIESIYHLYFSELLLLFSFLSSLENQYITPTFKFYLVTFIIQKLNWFDNKITHSHWCFQTNLVSWKKWVEMLINNFICIIIWHNFYIVALRVITCSSSTSLEETKLIAIVNWIFHVSDFWRLIIISLKYGLILCKCSFTDRFLLLSPLRSYSV